jgi:hypothetical protein
MPGKWFFFDALPAPGEEHTSGASTRRPLAINRGQSGAMAVGAGARPSRGQSQLIRHVQN